MWHLLFSQGFALPMFPVHPERPASLQGPLADVLLVPLPGRSSEAELQWRLQVNRLQELIDQLECKVRGWVASACPHQYILEAWSMFCVSCRHPSWNPDMKRTLPRGLTR